MPLQIITPSRPTQKIKKEVVLQDYSSMQDIADHFKVSKATVSRWARSSKNPMPSHRPPLGASKVVLFVLKECEIWFGGREK